MYPSQNRFSLPEVQEDFRRVCSLPVRTRDSRRWSDQIFNIRFALDSITPTPPPVPGGLSVSTRNVVVSILCPIMESLCPIMVPVKWFDITTESSRTSRNCDTTNHRGRGRRTQRSVSPPKLSW